MEKITILYFAVNIFCSGYCFGDKIHSTRGAYDFFVLILLTLGTILFGSIWVLGSLLVALIQVFFEYLNRTIQFKFWFEFYLTKRFHNVGLEQLTRLNAKAVKISNSNRIEDRAFKFGVKLINKRNKHNI